MRGEGIGIKVVLTLRALVDRITVLLLCLPLVIGCYAVWDGQMVYERADVTQWQPYRPTEPQPLSFWELQRLNPEVRAWLSVYGTKIDYPVCQSRKEEPNKYLTTNAKGEYALSGALYVDAGNTSDFGDFATIVYGHHMDNDVMFGPITRFAERGFFEERRYGNLFAADTNWGLEFFGYMDVDAYDKDVYRIVSTDAADRQRYLDLLKQRSRNWRDDVTVGVDDRIVLLSTCTSEGTNGRAILMAKICNQRFKNKFSKVPNLGTGVDEWQGLLGIPLWCWLLGAVFVALLAVLVLTRRGSRRRE